MVAIVGSREYPVKQHVEYVIGQLVTKLGAANLTIISGKARGVDTWAEDEAERLGAGTLVFPAKWRDEFGNYDSSAGFTRNTLIVEASEIVIAFWDGVSTGTLDTCRKALKLGKSVTVLDKECQTVPVEIWRKDE